VEVLAMTFPRSFAVTPGLVIDKILMAPVKILEQI